jgi:hypothetical protein
LPIGLGAGFRVLPLLFLAVFQSGCSKGPASNNQPEPPSLRTKTEVPYKDQISLNWIDDTLDTLKTEASFDNTRFKIAQGLESVHNRSQHQIVGKLTKFWAQEFIGADLSHTFLEKVSQTQSLRTPNIAIIDVGSMDKSLPVHLQTNPGPLFNVDSDPTPHKIHASAVSNLIFESGSVGVAYRAQPGFLSGAQSDILSRVKKVIAIDKKSGPYFHDLINVSMGSDGDGLYSAVFKEAKKTIRLVNNTPTRAIIPVIAAGNTDTKTLSLNRFIDHLHEDAIFVGSVSPIGVISDFSQAPDSTTIFAPSDYFVQTLAGDDRLSHTFSGTSGATPLVTGALANVKSLIENLTTDQAAILLKKTGTPLMPSLSDSSATTSVMLVNAYKLVRVAQRLQKNSWDDLSMPQKLALLQEDALYDFQAEAQEYLQIATGNLDALKDQIKQNPQAFNLETNPEAQAMFCSSLKQIILNLRTSSLLDSTTSAKKYLAVIYAQLGFALNSAFFKSLGSLSDLQDVITTALESPISAIPQAALLASTDIFPIDQTIERIHAIITTWSIQEQHQIFNAPFDIFQPVAKIKEVSLLENIVKNSEKKGTKIPSATWVAAIKMGENGARFALDSFQTRETPIWEVGTVLYRIPEKDPILPHILSILPEGNKPFSACVSYYVCKRIWNFEQTACKQSYAKHGHCVIR